ncbi:hypothetical protein ABKN59_011080 [Abortiporus biennis]
MNKTGGLLALESGVLNWSLAPTTKQAQWKRYRSLLLTLRLGFVFYGQGDQQHSQLLPNSHTEYSLFYYTHA